MSVSKIVRLTLVAVLMGSVACLASQPVPENPAPATNQEQLESWWTDLEKSGSDVSAALLSLADRQQEVVPFLKDRLKPLKITPKEVNEFLVRLASEEKNIWEEAFRELEYLDPRLAINLVTLMNKDMALPARARLVEVLSGRPAGCLKGKEVELHTLSDGDGYNFCSGGTWWAEHKVSRLNNWGTPKKKWTRAVRAIVLLDHIGTPDAIAILKDLATGHPDAQPTKVAKEVLAIESVSDDPGPGTILEQLKNGWADLEKSNPDVSRALLRLADMPNEVVPFLRDRLRPLKITDVEVNKLLVQLASDEKMVWEEAFRELEYRDPRLAIDLWTLMNKVPGGPARKRLVAVLSGRPLEWVKGNCVTLRSHTDGKGNNFYNFYDPSSLGSWGAESRISELNRGGGWSPPKKKWTRAVHAIVLLDHIGTPDAISILNALATGHPEAQPTRVAKELLNP